MSVPAERMAPVRPTGDPTKIMGVKKPIFYVIIVLGLVLAFYIWRRSKINAATNTAATAPTDTSQGLTAADIGGTPADNSFATNTDLTALEEQIQQMQNTLFQLQQSNGGNGAGIGGNQGTRPRPVDFPPGQFPVPIGGSFPPFSGPPGPPVRMNSGIASGF